MQCVNVDGAKSEWKNVLSGIPQGSVIGPLLFVIFINDMPESVKYNICKLFADDCKLYGTVNTDNLLQFDLSMLEKWSTQWQLPFNATKCKVMHFGYHNTKHAYHLNNHQLEVASSQKDLGVIIDDNMKFHTHSSAAAKKANQILGVIKKSYRTRDAKTMTTLYKSMVRPHLEYGNAIWGPFYKGDIRIIEAIQRRATKLIPQLCDKPYEYRLRYLKLPSLAHRRRRGDMIQMYKIINRLVRIDSEKLFTPARSGVIRGHAQKVFKHHAIKLTRSNSFSQRVVNDWNGLPNEVVSASSLNTFKNRLDNHWSSTQFDVSYL